MDLFKATELDPLFLKEIKKLHFQTRRLADQNMAGNYRSAFRGRGMEFEEVRDYFRGDDIRNIDWKVTARTGRPYIKSYREERELSVMIAVDVSASTLTGTCSQLRNSLIAKLGAVLSIIALSNNDKVGLVTYSDRLETYHPPRKTRSAVWRVLHEVLTPGEHHSGTDLSGLFSFLSRVLKRRAVIFVISDFIAADFEGPLATLAKRHDVTAIVISDPADYLPPSDSLLCLRDPESGRTRIIDTAPSKTKIKYQEQAENIRVNLISQFRKYRIGSLELKTNEPFIYELRKYFKQRQELFR